VRIQNNEISSLNKLLMYETHCLLMLTFPRCPGLNNLLSKSIFHSSCSVTSYNYLVRFWLQYIFYYVVSVFLPSKLWRCWLGGRKGIRPVKTEWWGAGMVVYLEQGADLHMAQLMPLPLTVSCFSKIQTCFTFLAPAHPGSTGQRAVKR